MQPYEHNPQAYDTGVVRSRVEVDQGLRAFMLGVYNHLSLGLAISALTALAINYLAMQTGVDGRMVPTSFGRTLYGSPVRYIVMFAPLAFIFFMLFALSVALVTAALTLAGIGFTEALVLCISALTTTGQLAWLAGEEPLSWAALSAPVKVILGLTMVLGRLETLALIALLAPGNWQGRWAPPWSDTWRQ